MARAGGNTGHAARVDGDELHPSHDGHGGGLLLGGFRPYHFTRPAAGSDC